jgi:uncharacterized repeat protein (TIGR04076 family)
MPDYDVQIDVVEIRGKGECSFGHKVGDKTAIGQPNLCPWAEHTLLPFATGLRFGGLVPWKEHDKEIMEICCPDPDNPVIFRLKRVLKES